jgi:NCS2 family nucleobase:cation symporter-2
LGISLFVVGMNNFAGGTPRPANMAVLEAAQQRIVINAQIAELEAEMELAPPTEEQEAELAALQEDLAALPTGAANPNFGSPLNMAIAFGVFGINMLLQRFGKGLFKISSILISMICGYVAAIFLGMVDFSNVADAGIFALPQPFGLRPEFHLWAITMFLAIFIVSALSTIGYTQSITNQALGREATRKEISGAIFADAVSSSVSAMLNSLPNTEFGQNAGIVAFTKIVNRWCIALCAFTLILASIFPKIGAVFAAMPPAVLGGAILSVFAMIFTNGIILVARSGFSPRNITMLTIIFGIGLGFAPPGNEVLIHSFPGWLQFVFSDRVLLISVVAVLVNLLFMTAEHFKQAKEERLKSD